MFNKFLRPWINQRRNSSSNPPTKFFVALTAMLLIGFGVQAQQTISNTAITPDHAAIQANKMPVPGTQTVPTAPMVPDPMISILPPGVSGDANYWNNMRRGRAINNAKSGGSHGGPLTYQERERKPGHNDVQRDAERISRFGIGRGKRNQAIITGSLGDTPNRALNQMEDDGSIPLALQTGINGGPDIVSFSGVIGDGPMAGSISDYDFVAASFPEGTRFQISVATPEPFGDLDPFVTLYNTAGQIIFQQDDGGNGFDTFADLTVIGGDLDIIFAIGGFLAFEPADPFNSTGGSITGLIGSEGSYDFTLIVFPPDPADLDTDFYKFHLNKGDVFGAAMDIPGFPRVEIYNSHGELEKGVTGFGSFADPNSPLPINGSGVIDYVVERSGEYAISVSGGLGPYTLELGVYEPEFEREKRRVQVLWCDYNGGPVDKAPWFGFPFVTNHTPFRDFLPNLGLPNADSDVRRMTRKITHEVRDNAYTELERAHINRNLGVVVLGNDGTGTPSILQPLIDAESFNIWGLTFEVSELEISGTIDEAFISTIGIASTIDPGNYSVYDDALVLLDIITAPATGVSADLTFRLNDVVLAPGVSKEDMVTTVIGNITAHEAGHYLGNFHTDGFTPVQTIMDQGPGGLFNLAGIGPSGIFGGADATDISFGTDMYAASEGFSGDENTGVNTAFALSYFWWGRIPMSQSTVPEELVSQLNTNQFDTRTILGQSIPNSVTVSGMATINFEVETDTEATIDIFDLAGNKVGNLFQGDVKGGEAQVVTLRAGDFNLKPGVYLYKLETPQGSQHRKIVVKE